MNSRNALVEQIFSDGIGTITIIGGTVRLDFLIFSPNEKDADGRPKAIHLQRIVMAPESFLHSAEKIQEAAQALTKLGTTAHPSAEQTIAEPSAEKPKILPPASERPAPPTAPKRPFP